MPGRTEDSWLHRYDAQAACLGRTKTVFRIDTGLHCLEFRQPWIHGGEGTRIHHGILGQVESSTIFQQDTIQVSDQVVQVIPGMGKIQGQGVARVQVRERSGVGRSTLLQHGQERCASREGNPFQHFSKSRQGGLVGEKRLVLDETTPPVTKIYRAMELSYRPITKKIKVLIIIFWYFWCIICIFFNSIDYRCCRSQFSSRNYG